MSILTQSHLANDEERERLRLLISELKRRGKPIPKELLETQVKEWPIDPNGYFVRMDGRLYTPNSQQMGFILSKARYATFRGGRGSGKSAAGAQKSLIKVAQGEDGAVMNPDFENFKVSTWPEFRQWIPWEMVVPSQRYRKNPEWQPSQPFLLAFMNGVRVICKGLKDADSARGPNINWLWYDESGRDKDGLAWKLATASVRVGYMPQAWTTTTPKGKSHWQYEFFEKSDLPEDALEAFESSNEDRPLIESFHGSIQDNRDNLDPGFYASMLAMYPGGYLRRQEIYGEYVDEGGAFGDSSWFNNRMLSEPPENVRDRVRFWDMAATEKKLTGKKKNDPDELVGTLMSWEKEYEEIKGGRFVIEDQKSGFFQWLGVKEFILRTAIEDGPSVRIIIEQEPGSGGKNQVAELDDFIRKNIPGHRGVEGYRPEGDRVMLANIWFANAKEGKMWVVRGDWVEGFFDQLNEFPEGKHDDKITSVSGARINVAPIQTWKDIKFLHL